VQLANIKINNVIVLRSLSTLSLLPNNSYVNTNASFVSGEEVSFTATRVTKDDEYYELAWAYPEEVALMASITIGAHPDFGKVSFFPARWPIYVVDEGQDLSDMKVLTIAESLLRAQLTESKMNSWEELPPFLTSRPYSFNDNLHLSKAYQLKLLHLIDINDSLMIRGLVHLLKTSMLRCLSRSFIDTACLEIYIALEATLEIILRKLRSKGVLNPSNKDASDYLLQSFGESYRLEKYYQEYYEDRIKAIHPNSRFGPAKFPPLFVDDLYMLYNDLLRTYEFLITAQPNSYEMT
jgi:hypothetical protein